MSEKATLVVTAIPFPNEMASVQSYLKDVMPILTGVGGKLVKRLKVSDVIMGNPSGMVLIMDFDSDKTVTEVFESDAYKALIPARDKGFAQMNILLTHEM